MKTAWHLTIQPKHKVGVLRPVLLGALHISLKRGLSAGTTCPQHVTWRYPTLLSHLMERPYLSLWVLSPQFSSELWGDGRLAISSTLQRGFPGDQISSPYCPIHRQGLRGRLSRILHPVLSGRQGSALQTPCCGIHQLASWPCCHLALATGHHCILSLWDTGG